MSTLAPAVLHTKTLLHQIAQTSYQLTSQTSCRKLAAELTGIHGDWAPCWVLCRWSLRHRLHAYSKQRSHCIAKGYNLLAEQPGL